MISESCEIVSGEQIGDGIVLLVRLVLETICGEAFHGENIEM